MPNENKYGSLNSFASVITAREQIEEQLKMCGIARDLDPWRGVADEVGGVAAAASMLGLSLEKFRGTHDVAQYIQSIGSGSASSEYLQPSALAGIGSGSAFSEYQNSSPPSRQVSSTPEKKKENNFVKNDCFIQSIEITKIRHIKGAQIDLDKNQSRHLIITGANGSGKTSVLNALKNYLEIIPSGDFTSVYYSDKIIDEIDGEIATKENLLKNEKNYAVIHGLESSISSIKEKRKILLIRMNDVGCVKLLFSDADKLFESYKKGEFLISYFGVKRSSEMQAVNGAKKLELPKITPILVNEDSIGSYFVQFLVNQENRAAQFYRKSDRESERAILQWQNMIRDKFRELFDNDKLELVYDVDNFDFTINIQGREPFRMTDNQLSDGYSAVIHIVAELLMRMEGMGRQDYAMPGIVLIDEIETHLHIKLQKTILPFLTSFFPNIQFIVTTHSPFVLTSLNNAVVFDLEMQKRWENMIPLSASTVIEEYFESDLYSNNIKRMMERYKKLSVVKERTAEQESEFQKIRQEFDKIEYDEAPELVAAYNELRARESAR